METAQFLTLAGLSAVSICLCIYLLTKIRTITYLLEQPVVKKMSPQLKLKPVKVDELEESRVSAAPSRNIPNGSAQNRGPRPVIDVERGRENRDYGSRESRDRNPRSERPEGETRREGGDRADRGPRGERNDRGERGDQRGDRFGGRDRERGGRNERGERERFGDRMGGRDRSREGFGGEREPAIRDSAAVTAHVESAPAAALAPALAPRRPLPSTVDQENPIPKEAPIDALAANPSAEDALFNRDDSDIQHGRRHQPKKKPRFDVASEEEVKEETKAL